MGEELRKLITRRGQIKSRLTRFKLFLDEPTQITSEFQLSSRLTKLRECWPEFDSVQTEIETISTDTKSQSELQSERETFEENYFSLETRFEELLRTRVSNIEQPYEAGHPSPTTHIQLPVLKLPTFGGAYDEWLPFHDTFQSLIHGNISLTSIQKFHYLKSSLKEEASHLLDSLEISDTNYEVAWGLLKERYENKRIIVSKHIREIFDLTPVIKESVSSLRRLLDDSLKHVRALKTLGQPTDSWDSLLIHIISHKLDPLTRRAWELTLTTNEPPHFEDLVSFLSQRCKMLEASESCQFTHYKQQSNSSAGVRLTNNQPQRNYIRKTSSLVLTQPDLCPLCEKDHRIFKCNTFNNLTIPERIERSKRLNLCMNCLRRGHLTINCKSGSCKKCSKRHNTLLHLDHNSQQSSAASINQSHSNTGFCLHNTNDFHQTILATAVINIADLKGDLYPCRVLLDSGSQSNFMTESLSRSLGLRRIKSFKPIIGINHSISNASYSVHTCVHSRINAFNANLEFFILPKITQDLPSVKIDWSSFKIPRNIPLADPHYKQPRRIDALIGAELFWQLLCVGQIRISKNLPILQKTVLGWVISGRAPSIANPNNKQDPLFCHLSTQGDNLETLIKQFWEIEQINKKSKSLLSEEEAACEEHFKAHVRRESSGRFVVSLPFRHDPSILGRSRANALLQFQKLERRFLLNRPLKIAYRGFINEYLELDHMAKLQGGNLEDSNPAFYLPHHPIFKQSSSTKLRVVFNGSARSSTGMSLNDVLMVGPVIQRDLFSILLSFRFHAFVFTTDIQKMYRQIRLHAPDTSLQRILWRENPGEEIETYCLSTVTYGLAPSSFLATRCLQQLAVDERNDFPRATTALMDDCYVDDVITGANSLQEAVRLQDELRNMLARAGFKLHKWCANHPRLLETIEREKQECEYTLPSDAENTIKTLGLMWQPTMDYFKFTVSPMEPNYRISKRTILSDISRLFDPLGLLGPIIIRAKIMMQKLWQLRLDWDESIPAEMHTEWIDFRKRLVDIKQINIPRNVTATGVTTQVQLQGFCDASEVAYGACIYIRCIIGKEKFETKLLCAKSRVAPLKKTTIPRLELCSALLLSQLAHKVSTQIPKIDKFYLWSDSKIVLTWLSASPNSWKTFVANRVAEIQELTENMEWGHVSSADNPADILSRGASPLQLLNSQSWWMGPVWLKNTHPSKSGSNYQSELSSTELERKGNSIASYTAVDSDFKLFEKYSSLSKLKRVTAYCLRFIKNTRLPKRKRNLGVLTMAESRDALLVLIKSTQQHNFGLEVKALNNLQELPAKSKLKSLSPFLDNTGIIRVGGRLKKSQLNYNQKHPIVLPEHASLTKLIMTYFHIASLHTGPQALLYEVRQFYWPLRGRKLAHKTVRSCLKCFKVKPSFHNQLMGDLPDHRVVPTRAFTNTGIDYCGPIFYRHVQLRRRPPIKGYIALFICLSTKAIHLELVTDLTTETFLAALRRFMARRGKPENLYSDNATNFVGARNELAELRRLFQSKHHQGILNQTLSVDNIEWHFIPPRSPHFGGLWEAGIKSVKHHLRRIVANAILTFEELNTLIIQIEACLNSRPLTPMSNDPNDLMPLTPGHFLIGQPLTLTPEPSLLPLKVNRLSRWQHVQQLAHSFWKRWSSEYLSSLQQRTKWTIKRNNIKEGMLVLISEDNQPPLKWTTARIVELHPGKDGLCRVATVKTSKGVLKRAITKLCILPIEQ